MSEQVYSSPSQTPQAEQQPPFDLRANLDAYAEQNARLAAEIDQYTGSGKFPEWWYEDTSVNQSELNRHIVNTDVTGEEILSFYLLSAQRDSLGKNTTGRVSPSTIELLYHSVSGELSADKFALALHSEAADGELHKAVLAGFNTDDSGMPTTQVDILRAFYGVNTATELFGVKGAGYDNAVHDVLRHERAIDAVGFIDAEKPAADATWADMIRCKTEWTAKAIASAANIDMPEADGYAFGIAKRSDHNEALGRMLGRIDVFGVERLRKISSGTGIRAFDAYSVPQLEQMENVISHPAIMAEELKDTDITVVMTNRVGDHNGVLRDVAADFEQENGSTSLFFEIESLTDIYRYAAKLKRLGIKPAILTLAAHSNEGMFLVTDERDPSSVKFDVAAVAGKRLVALLNKDKTWTDTEGMDVSGHAIEALDSLAKLVDEYMTPSELDGTKKIIFQACHAASEAPVNELNSAGDKQRVGEASVISRMAETLMKNDVKSVVELYGAEGGIQLHRSERGVEYTGTPLNFGSGRTPKYAKKIRIENGEAAISYVDEIVLRK